MDTLHKKSTQVITSLKWLLVPERINFTILKLTFKGLLTERMPSNLQLNIVKKPRTLRKSTEMAKLVSIEDPDNHSHFLNYATKLYNDIPMQIREIENYKQVVLKLKKIFI